MSGTLAGAPGPVSPINGVCDYMLHSFLPALLLANCFVSSSQFLHETRFLLGNRRQQMHVPQPMLQLKKLTHQRTKPIADGIIGNRWCSWELRAPWHPKITTKAIVAKTRTGEVAAVLDSKLQWDLFNSLHFLLAIPCEAVI